MTRLLQRAADEQGSELAEFSLCVVIWMLFVALIAYGSFTLYAAHYVANAADESARYAIVRGSTWTGTSCSSTTTINCAATSANVTSFAQSMLPPGLTASQLTVSTTWPGTTLSGTTCDSQSGANSPNCIVKVQVSYTLTYPFPFLTNTTLPLSAGAQMAIFQ